MPVHSYFVCATPRTGSSLLLGLLASTGVAGRPHAYFRGPDRQLWAQRWGLTGDGTSRARDADFVAAALAAGSTPNGVFGAKLMRDGLEELLATLRRLHPDIAAEPVLIKRIFGRASFLYLERDDVVAQAVSWARAEQTNAWFVGGHGEVGDNESNGRAPRYDRAELDRLVARIEQERQSWEAWFRAAGVVPHRLRYEELTADMDGVVQHVLQVLGVSLPAGAAATPRHSRQGDALNDEWAARYRAGG